MTRASRSGDGGMVIAGSVGPGVALRGPEGEGSEALTEMLGNASAPEAEEEAVSSTMHERWLRRR